MRSANERNIYSNWDSFFVWFHNSTRTFGGTSSFDTLSKQPGWKRAEDIKPRYPGRQRDSSRLLQRNRFLLIHGTSCEGALWTGTRFGKRKPSGDIKRSGKCVDHKR